MHDESAKKEAREPRTSFYSLSLPALKSALTEAGFEKYRAEQIFDAVYKNKIFNPQNFSNLPAALRTHLEKNYEFCAALPVKSASAGPDAEKFLFELSDGKFIEAVLLSSPAEDEKNSTRKTLCLSTQVGCASKCAFCASALNGFIRNLSSGEIVAQALPFVSEEKKTGKEKKFCFENIVVMGMGEPLANLENLLEALKIFNASDKFAFGARRITVSTCGLADKIEKLAEMEFPYKLAISLHSANDETRSRIMPVNKKFNLQKLVSSAKKFSKAHGRMLTLEYVLIKGVNDFLKNADELSKIAKTLQAHVNLIPYNPVPSLSWERPSKGVILAFSSILQKNKISYTLRREKGDEINAACGQLALKKNKS